MLLRRSAWQAVGGYDERMRDGGEDWEFNIRLTRVGLRGIELPKPLFVYAVRPDGMLLSHATRMHGTLWRYIRAKHADLYRPSALLRCWRTTRTLPSKVSGAAATGLLVSAKVLPESWFNALFLRVLSSTRARRIGRGEISAAVMAGDGAQTMEGSHVSPRLNRY
jgi:GT2 family glycosyltransferase